jgi:hypothetical protein
MLRQSQHLKNTKNRIASKAVSSRFVGTIQERLKVTLKRGIMKGRITTDDVHEQRDFNVQPIKKKGPYVLPLKNCM